MDYLYHARGDYRKITTVVCVTVGSLWLLRKLSRAAVHYLFPSVLPGDENTALLASVSPNTSSPVTAKDLEGVTEYDYIIIGTGTAGCVIASRLTESSNASVLAIESGLADAKQLLSRIPAGFAQLYGTPVDYDIRTTAQPNCADRELQWPRGKMIGGCSSINAMIYNRGAPDDYDEWARLGNEGWSYDELAPYMSKAESYNGSIYGSPYTTIPPEDLKQHGKNGPWQIGYSWITPIVETWVDACAAIGLKKNPDFNTKRGLAGASVVQTFIDKNGVRSSTAAAYLTPDVCTRPNLKIAAGQTVTRIIFDQSGSTPRAVGVEMASGKATPVRYVAKARKEVILCAGAVHSPHVLQLSGVGPAHELAKHNIPVVKDIPGVGQNLADHIFDNCCFSVPSGSSLQFLASPLASLPKLVQWLRTGKGPMSTNVAEAIAFLRTVERDDAPAALKNNDLSSGPTSADLELLVGPVAYFEHGKYVPPTGSDYFSVGAIMLRPTSRGTVTLANADAFTNPIVDPNYLSSQHDVDLMVYGMKLSIQTVRSKEFKQLFGEWHWPKHWQHLCPAGDYDAMTDAELAKYVRHTCETIYHPMCTAKMGPASDATAVVDPQLRVHGIDGLRVADASIFATPVACHPCAPVVMVAEKAAELIKKAA